MAVLRLYGLPEENDTWQQCLSRLLPPGNEGWPEPGLFCILDSLGLPSGQDWVTSTSRLTRILNKYA